MLARAFQPAIEQPPGQPGQAVRDQVHHREGDVLDDIDAAQGGIELDAVEGHHLAAEGEQVGEVQVAMAFAHVAGRGTRLPQRQHGDGFAGDPAGECFARQQVRGPASAASARSRRSGPPAAQAGAAAWKAASTAARRSTVAASSSPCAARSLKRRRGKAPHPHGMGQRRPGAVQVRRGQAARDARHAQVQPGASRPLSRTSSAQKWRRFLPSHSRRSAAQRLLQLVRELRREQHPGDVRLPHFGPEAPRERRHQPAGLPGLHGRRACTRCPSATVGGG
jgi:hypothetical protein